MVDMVNHPAHYTSDPSGVECIDIVRHRNYNIGNAIKYLWRAGLKNEDKHIEDLKKAIFYITDEIKRLESMKISPARLVDNEPMISKRTLASLDMRDKYGKS